MAAHTHDCLGIMDCEGVKIRWVVALQTDGKTLVIS